MIFAKKMDKGFCKANEPGQSAISSPIASPPSRHRGRPPSAAHGDGLHQLVHEADGRAPPPPPPMSASRSVGESESISSLRKSAGAAPPGSYPSRRSHPPSSTRSCASSLVMLRQPGVANLSSCERKIRCAPGSSETNASAPRAFGLRCSWVMVGVLLRV